MNTRFRTRLLLIAFNCLLPLGSTLAEEAAITIEKSESPDGRRDIVLLPPMDDTGISSGTAKIRNLKTGGYVGSFQWSGFGVHATATSFDVLWAPDSRCFAINWELTRGFVTCAVYAQTGYGWRQVKLPELSKPTLRRAQAAGENRVYIDENWGGKGHETALRWLSGHRLQIEAGYRGIINRSKEDWEQLYWFTFHVVPPRAVLKSLKSAPDTAYRND